MDSLDKMLKALADRTRLRIIGILLSREACVCDMQAILGLPQPLLSRHLAYMLDIRGTDNEGILNRLKQTIEGLLHRQQSPETAPVA
jgi:DNA-binding transcriptional ArsR family regulator